MKKKKSTLSQHGNTFYPKKKKRLFDAVFCGQKYVLLVFILETRLILPGQNRNGEQDKNPIQAIIT
jgi:hypothetical protein